MQPWSRKSDALFELIPDGSSSFLLAVKRTDEGKWVAFAGGEQVDEGRTFPDAASAQKAAVDSYDNYWSDFEEPSDGW